jgi:methylated-DNA-[protein]-cysteine S-methyltransferase
MAPGGTPFQRRVWDEIRRIPYGETLSYAELARRAGAPGSARAAGAATGRNPLSIVVPCHRVIAIGGSLTGYAGGLERKARLLEIEGALRAEAA